MFSKKCVNSFGNRDICTITYTKRRLVHSASRFMQRIGMKQTQLQFNHSNCVI